jgi:5-methylcytosine-specific restriction protein A
MPTRPKRPCRYANCPELVDFGYCAKHHQPQRASRHERGYSTHYTTRFRPWFMARHPVCESIHGCFRPAEEVHHLTSLADGGSACDESNCQSLCRKHHQLLGAQGGRG